MRRRIIPLAVALVGLLAVAGVSRGRAAEPVSFSPCSDCHEDLTAAFAQNPHVRALAAGETDGASICQKCHGDTSNHVDSGDPADVHVPKGKEPNTLCITCHEPAAHGGAENRAHRRGSMSCTSCHSIHGGTAENPAPHPAEHLLQKQPPELCATCHPTEAASFKKPYGHRLREGGMTCVSCHDPHGGTRDGSLRAGGLGRLPCFDCHGEKAGPFVFEHVTGVTGDCRSCHEPHGSSNPRMLTRTNVRQVCLECHTALPAGLLGSQPPSFHDLTLPRYRNCTTCHVAIHGSNSAPDLTK